MRQQTLHVNRSRLQLMGRHGPSTAASKHRWPPVGMTEERRTGVRVTLPADSWEDACL